MENCALQNSDHQIVSNVTKTLINQQKEKELIGNKYLDEMKPLKESASNLEAKENKKFVKEFKKLLLTQINQRSSFNKSRHRSWKKIHKKQLDQWKSLDNNPIQLFHEQSKTNAFQTYEVANEKIDLLISQALEINQLMCISNEYQPIRKITEYPIENQGTNFINEISESIKNYEEEKQRLNDIYLKQVQDISLETLKVNENTKFKKSFRKLVIKQINEQIDMSRNQYISFDSLYKIQKKKWKKLNGYDIADLAVLFFKQSKDSIELTNLYETKWKELLVGQDLKIRKLLCEFEETLKSPNKIK